MKTFLILLLAVCCYVQVAVSEELTFSQITRKWAERRVPYACECIKRTTVSPVTLDNWIHYGEYAKCGRLMCSIHYIYSDLGIIGPDNEFVKDKFIAATFLPVEKAEEVYNKCAHLKGRNNCNTAYIVDQCAYEEIKLRAVKD